MEAIDREQVIDYINGVYHRKFVVLENQIEVAENHVNDWQFCMDMTLNYIAMGEEMTPARYAEMLRDQIIICTKKKETLEISQLLFDLDVDTMSDQDLVAHCRKVVAM
jgi:hypothetical protein